MSLREPGLRSDFPKLSEKYGVETYAELVDVIEANEKHLVEIRGILSRRKGRIDRRYLYAVLRHRGIKISPARLSFLLKLRKNYRLPSPAGVLSGPWLDNPILVLLGTHGPTMRHYISDRLQYVHYEDPLTLLTEVHRYVVIKNGRSLDRRRLKVQELSLGSSGRYILLKSPIEGSEQLEKYRVPVIEIGKLVDKNSILIPLWRP